MALIGTIRKNSWLLIVLLGLALAAFIIMDVTSSQSMGGGDQFKMGTVNGEDIDYRQFNRAEQILYSGSQADVYSTRDYLWNYFVEKELVQEAASNLGLTVSRDELMDLQFGTNLSPVIRQRFSNPQTGRVDRTQLNNIKQSIQAGNLPANIRPFWAMQEKEIIKTRLQNKFISLVSQGMYVPTWYVKQQNTWNGKTAKVAFVKVPFAAVTNADIQVSAADVAAYLEKHSELYKNEQETRVAKYVQLEVAPTSEDSAAIYETIVKKKKALAETSNDSLYAVNNNGMFVNIYATEEELPQGIPDTVLSMDIGSIYGPFINGQYYELVEVVDKMIVPDSVHARHIIRIASPQQPQAVAQATQLLDSLKNLLVNGQASFDSLALQYSQGQLRTSGGDLGTFSRTQMLPLFSYEVFYKGKEGDYLIFQSSQGVHLVEILDQIYETNSVGAQLAIVRAPIVPSEETQNKVYDHALDLVAKNRTLEELKATLEKSEGNLQLNATAPLEENAYRITELNNPGVSRSIVQWMYKNDTRIGDVSSTVYIVEHPTFYYNSSFVVAGLYEIMPAGLPDATAVKDKISPLVVKEKKGEILQEKLKSKSLAAIASEYGTDVDTARQLQLGSNSIVGLGVEPQLIGAIFSLENGSVSTPIIGNNGVYVVKKLTESVSPSTGNIATVRSRITQNLNSQVQLNVMGSMKEAAEIVDNRSKFY